MKNSSLTAIFFGLAACSWVPHWACHYYRLETGSSFVVGSWEFSPLDSVLSMSVYSVLILLNLLAIVYRRPRFTAAFASGILHILIGSLHIVRIVHPFRFEVFGYPWPLQASIREILVVFPFGILCLVVAFKIRKKQAGL